MFCKLGLRLVLGLELGT